MNPQIKTGILIIALLIPRMNLASAAEAQLEPATTSSGSSTGLPLSEIVLFTSGVGYFHRHGEVQGKTEVELRFRTEDINDLLKSMVVRDRGGGRISAVTYESRDPLSKTLKSFGIDLTSHPSLGELLKQVRGEPVEIRRPNLVSGTILGVEQKPEPAGDGQVVEREHLNLLTEEGLQSVPLKQVQKIQLLNDRLNTELRQALTVLAASHDTQKKSVRITFDGTGERPVDVAYIAQAPVWKTTYRLVLQEDEPPYLQGWAIVENTGDEDWENVRLALVSGRPISFRMDLYQPLYTERPEVELDLYSSLRPQVYEESMERTPVPAKPAQSRPQPMAQDMAGVAERRLEREAGRGVAAKRQSSVAADGSMLQAGTFFEQIGLGDQATAQGAQTGELFQYTIQSPVTLPRQKSAMLPIVDGEIDGEKVAIYNQQVQAKHPLHGFRLKNTTALHLMQGPITVFEDGVYAGDAQIDDIARGQERLLSYALDLKTEVEPQQRRHQTELVSVALQKGTLIAKRKAMQELTYHIRNRDQKDRRVLVEHPFQSDWDLVEPDEPLERTREVYRFLVQVPADEQKSLLVRQEKTLSERVGITNLDSDRIALYIQAPEVSAQVKQALQKVVSLRDQLNQTQAKIQARQTQIQEIDSEQSRIRENMTRLDRASDLYVRYVKKLDEQETELETLREQIGSLRQTQAEQKRALDEYLLNLELE